MINDKPLKRFGQNYLVDQNIIKKIINEIDPQFDDNLIEIGPGEGALTKFLSESLRNITGIEIDNRKIESLKNRFNNIEVINKDFLEIDLKPFAKNKKIRIVGNLPYYITSPILFQLIENIEYVYDATIMVQYEVAKRMTAGIGTKDYGILSVILNYFAEVKFCFKISPNVFYPKPKVFSALVQLKFKDNFEEEINNNLFIKIVKACFGNRRKTLKNSLSNSIFKDYNFSDIEDLLKLRAENLSIQDFIKITKLVQSQDDRIKSK